MGKLLDSGLGNDFLDLTEAKINKWNYVKLNSFCTTKETNKMKTQSMEWEKMFANQTYKGLIYKNMENTYNSIKKKSTQLKT